MSRQPLLMPFPTAIGDSEWIRLTGAANDAFADGRFGEALTLYHDAFEEAERLFRNASAVSTSVPTATIYVISCQNLADAMRKAGEPHSAHDWLCRAFERLATAAESPATPLSLRLDCMRDLKFALLGLMESRHGQEAFQPEMERYLVRGRKVVAAVMNAVDRLATLPAGDFRQRQDITGRQF